ncbi:MAG: amidohydrolase [Anaerolineae bacterium]
METELLLYNGRIHTQEADRPLVSVLLVRGSRIAYLGDDPTADGLARRATGRIDLHGACVIPGLMDAHMHLQWFAQSLLQVNAEQPTLQAVLDDVKHRAASLPKGTWITGFGWNHNQWGGEFPTAAQLDTAAPEHSVCLYAKSGHASWVNSVALALAGIGAHTPDPSGGKIVRDTTGQPTGILLESASALLEPLIPVATPESMMPAYRQALELAARAGLTGLHDMDGPDSFTTEQMLLARGELSLRIVKSIPLAHLDQAIGLGLRSGFGSDRLRLGQVKMFSDGALGPRTAWMLAPYETEPRTLGIETTPHEEIREAVAKANAAGLACAIHAIGDRAVHEALNTYAACAQTGLRNRIEHVQIIDPHDLPRLAQFGVIASMQPLHATSDMDIADRHWGARAANAYAWRSILDSGAVIACGSDCPVEVIDPLTGLHAAITRRRPDGSPGLDGWYPEQRLTPEQAVRGYTWGPAFAAGMEDRLGSLAPGKLADMTVLEHDILTGDPMAILGNTVLATVVDGSFVWRDPGLNRD